MHLKGSKQNRILRSSESDKAKHAGNQPPEILKIRKFENEQQHKYCWTY